MRPAAQPLDATVSVPGSKSLTQRALLGAALAEGTSRVTGALLADDTAAMADCLGRLGAHIDRSAGQSGDALVVQGNGGELPANGAELYVNQSGVAARFLAPLLATGTGTYRLDGDEQMRRRPMGPLFSALRSLGASVDDATAASPGHLPAMISGPVQGGAVRIPGSITSQFVSGLMMAAPLTAQGLTIEIEGDLVSRPYVEMTAAALTEWFALAADVTDHEIVVDAGRYRNADIAVEPDASAAAYFFAAAALRGGRVNVAGLHRSSRQGDLAILDILARMGATTTETESGITVEGSGHLAGVDVDMSDLPDQAPTIAVVAAFATSTTRVRGVGFTRGHESDRIAGVVEEVARLGATTIEHEDGFTIEPGHLRGDVVLESRGDHRMAMALALAGLRVTGVQIRDPRCVTKTFPDFWAVLDELADR